MISSTVWKRCLQTELTTCKKSTASLGLMTKLPFPIHSLGAQMNATVAWSIRGNSAQPSVVFSPVRFAITTKGGVRTSCAVTLATRLGVVMKEMCVTSFVLNDTQLCARIRQALRGDGGDARFRRIVCFSRTEVTYPF